MGVLICEDLNTNRINLQFISKRTAEATTNNFAIPSDQSCESSYRDAIIILTLRSQYFPFKDEEIGRVFEYLSILG